MLASKILRSRKMTERSRQDGSLVEYARRAPVTALRRAAKRLDPASLAEAARLAPATALRYAAARLPTDVLAECARKEPA